VGIPAIVTAGDRRASRAVYGESKVHLELAGKPLVVWVVEALQRVPEVDSVWVVGNAERLEAEFDAERRAALAKPLHIVEQFRNLYENCWQTFLRTLPGAGPDGKEPEPSDEHAQALLLSADLPFATPQEISDFIRQGQASGADYALGLVRDEALADFLPREPGGPGIPVAYFNLREGRLRQNNLHLAKPLRMGARQYIEDMYENRHQRELIDQLRMAWRLLVLGGSASILLYYALMHLAGVADRWGLRAVADFVRRFVAIERVERVCGRLLKTDFRFVVTRVGGCAIDIDTEAEYDAARDRFDEWRDAQRRRAEAAHGALPPVASAAPPRAVEGERA